MTGRKLLSHQMPGIQDHNKNFNSLQLQNINTFLLHIHVSILFSQRYLMKYCIQVKKIYTSLLKFCCVRLNFTNNYKNYRIYCIDFEKSQNGTRTFCTWAIERDLMDNVDDDPQGFLLSVYYHIPIQTSLAYVNHSQY
jgi:hypothetical protein